MIIIFILRTVVRFSVFVFICNITQHCFVDSSQLRWRIMSWSVAVTKDHKLSDLKENYSQGSGGQESKIRASAALIPSGGLGESLVQAFLLAPSDPSGSWCPCKCLTPVSASISMWLFLVSLWYQKAIFRLDQGPLWTASSGLDEICKDPISE